MFFALEVWEKTFTLLQNYSVSRFFRWILCFSNNVYIMEVRAFVEVLVG